MSAEERAVLRLAQPPLLRFLPGLGLGLLSALCSVALLATSAWLITRASEHPPILYLSAAIVGVRAFALGRAGFRYAERLASHSAAFRQLGQLRVGVYTKLEPLLPDGLGTGTRGDLMTRMVADVDRLPDLPLRVVQPIVVAVVTAAVSVVGVTILLPAAGLALLISLVLGFVIATLVHSAVSSRAERAIAPLRGRLADLILETVSSLDVLIAFDAIGERLDAIDAADRAVTGATRRRALGAGATSAALAGLSGLATVIALWIAIPAAASGAIAAPTLAVIALIPLAVFDVMGGAPLAVSAWRQVRVSAQRVADVAEHAPVSRPVVTTSAPARGHHPVVELRDVAVRWPGARHDTVRGFSLALEAGDRVHIAGTTGAGKTTLAHALVGFLPYRGSYTILGNEVAGLPENDVRRVVGLCEQSPYLFDSDLRQNLLLARDTATDAELLVMLDRVGLAEWADSRNGLDTMLGDGGSLVSGGQAQRIALARALLADFPVVVFDEPTANVEEELAGQLMSDILSTVADDDRVVIVISHTAIDPALVTRTVQLTPATITA
ncbi:MAG: thiol reductant ABC exporter subunit CydC [Actinomycetota bacterium]